MGILPKPIDINGVRIFGGVKEVKSDTIYSPDGNISGSRVTLSNGVSLFLSADSQTVAANKQAGASIFVNEQDGNTTNTSFDRIVGFNAKGTKQKDVMRFAGCQTLKANYGNSISGYTEDENGNPVIDNDEITVLDSYYHGNSYKSDILFVGNRGDSINGQIITKENDGAALGNDNIPKYNSQTYTRDT